MSSSSEDEAVAARRRLIARSLQAAQSVSLAGEADSGSGSSSSSSSSSSGDKRLKPVFVPKGQRTTIIEREAKLREEQEAEEQRRVEEEEFALRMKERALQEAAIEDTEDSAGISGNGLKVPDLGTENTEEDYQKWRLRELKRILLFRTGKTGDEEDTAEDDGDKTRSKGAFFRS